MPNKVPTDISLTKFEWTKLSGSNSYEYANALSSGSDGSIYIAGDTYGDLDGQSNNGGYDAFFSKFNADGTKDWSRLLGTSGSEYAKALTIGTDGSIYIAGYTNGDLDGQTNNGGVNDAFISKYKADGTKDWTRLLGTNEYDWANALTTGADGSIYIAGVAYGDLDGETYNGFQDAFISKFNADGTKSWTRLIGTGNSDEAKGLITGPDGSIYIAGETWGILDGQTNNGGKDAFIIKFNADGTKDWTRLLGTSNSEDANALTIGVDGSIYIAGHTNGDLDGQTNNGGKDAFISKFNADGTKDWTRLLGTNSSESAKALTTGANGSIYIAGHTNGDLGGQTNHGGDTDAFISRFNPNGTLDWTRLLGTNSSDSANALATVSNGLVYITGYTTGDLDGQKNSGGRDAFISKFIEESHSINENIATSSTVATLSTTDADLSDTHTYSLVTGSGDTDNNSFTIDGSSLKIKASPDYETKSSYDIRLQTTDSNGKTYAKAFTISVNDLNEFIATIEGTPNSETLQSTGSNDFIDGLDGTDTVAYIGSFSNYSFTRSKDTLQIADQRMTGMTSGTDTLKNIEYIQFTDQTVEESKVDVVKTYSGNFSDYKFYNKGNGVYQIKTNSGYDDITGIPKLTFSDKPTGISAIADIKGTFDQVTGLNTDSGEMFRLYNAAFARFPDADGLKYWIDEFSSGRNTRRVVAQSFLGSAEFTEKYGSNVSDETYVNNLYKNVLGRDADTEGLNYWVGNLSSGVETRYEALLGFAESAENKVLFTDMTGFG